MPGTNSVLIRETFQPTKAESLWLDQLGACQAEPLGHLGPSRDVEPARGSLGSLPSLQPELSMYLSCLQHPGSLCYLIGEGDSTASSIKCLETREVLASVRFLSLA